MLFSVATIALKAQTPAVAPTTQPYGTVSMEDLQMKACDFEKDANAEILFDKGDVSIDNAFNLVFEKHERLKIFNDKGKNEADVRIQYYSADNYEYISNLQAETINLTDGKTEITKVDKKLIYTQRVNKLYSAITFTFPNVKPGSIVELKYTRTNKSVFDFPDWYFQNDIPTRYSELKTNIPYTLYYKNMVFVHQPWVKNTDDTKAIANIPSLGTEPFMSSKKDNYERILYQLKNFNAGASSQSFSDTWTKVGEDELDYDDFGGQFNRKLSGEDVIIAKAKTLTSTDEKIAYIFGQVKNTMKWDENDERYTNDGTAEAWAKKIGNSTEINLIVFHLLKKTGIKAYPMLVSTRGNGRVNPGYPSRYQFNRTVTYFPIDSNRFYILDATNKHNVYNEIPNAVLNGFGFYINKEDKVYAPVFIQRTEPVRNVIILNAEIKPDGKVNGTAQLNSFSYDRIHDLEKYNKDGEKKYIEYLQDGDNNLKISSLKLENMEVDSLPLTQNINFDLNLTGSDDNYIYFNPGLFAAYKTNPFLKQDRFTDIDFGYLQYYSISGLYKLPAGYKIDALPKSVSMGMPDKSIVFRRIIAEQEGSIMIRYSIDFKKSLYFKEDYPDFYDFFKKMTEMLNEQVVLKKI